MAINWQSDGSQVAAKVGVTSVRREEEEEAVSRWPEGRWCSSVAAKSELRWPAKPPPAGANWGPDDGSPLATGCPRQPSDDGAPPARPAMAPATAAAAPATTTPAAPVPKALAAAHVSEPHALNSPAVERAIHHLLSLNRLERFMCPLIVRGA